MASPLDRALSGPRSILWRGVWEKRGGNADLAVARGGIGTTQQELDATVRYIADVLHLGPDDTLLDIGCSVGYMAGNFAGRVKHITAVDVASAAVSRARDALRNYPGADVFQSEATHIAKPSGSFSKIVCFSVAHYFPSKAYWKQFLTEVKRLLEPGGVALVGDLPEQGKLDFDLMSEYSLLTKLYMIPVTIAVDVVLQERYTQSEVADTAAEAGLAATIVRQPKSLPFHASRFDVLLTHQ